MYAQGPEWHIDKWFKRLQKTVQWQQSRYEVWFNAIDRNLETQESGHAKMKS